MIAYGDAFMQAPYYLAAQADEVYLHPEGMVLITGYGGFRQYYKEGLDKFGVEMHVFRVGEYKSAVEPYLRNDMSKEAREMSLDTYGDLWRGWLGDVAAARKLQPDDISALVEAMPDRLRAAGGDPAKLALDAKLVDKLAPRDEVRKRLIALTGEDKEKHPSSRSATATTWSRRVATDGRDGAARPLPLSPRARSSTARSRPERSAATDGARFAAARENDDVKAVVLRASTAQVAAPSPPRSSAASASSCASPASPRRPR